MLQKPPNSENKKADTDSPAVAALKCAYQVMQQRIISNPKDMIGVLLYGMQKSRYGGAEDDEDGLAYPHCYLLTDLDVPDATAVRTLSSLAESKEECDNLLVPAKDRKEVTMSNVLFCANQIFTTKAPNFGSRRLFIITDNENPHEDDKAMLTASAVRAKDLYDLGVTIELFPIARSGEEFDRAKFYDDVIYTPEAASGEAMPSVVKHEKNAGTEGLSLLSSLISDVNSKQVAKRALFSNLPFEIAPGLNISVKGYNVFQRQKPARNCYVWLKGEEAMIARGRTDKKAEEDREEEQEALAAGEPDKRRTVKKDEIRKAYKFGGEQVLFTPEEQKELKNFGPPGLRIIGFKPQSMLPKWASVNKSTFIYPSEEDFVGSTRVFSALWEKLLRDKKMGLGWYIARANANPALVAILPSEEAHDEKTGKQLRPSGLFLYPLPYADDIRQPAPSPKPLVSSDEMVDKFDIVVQQLKLPKGKFDPARYPNPALQWHYKILQAMALQEEVPVFSEKDDKTLPKVRQIHKRAGEYLVGWGQQLEKEYNDYTSEQQYLYGGFDKKKPAAGTKRKAPAKKTTGMEVDYDDEDVKEMQKNARKRVKTKVEQGEVSKENPIVLRDFCRQVGLKADGSRADLASRIEEFYAKLGVKRLISEDELKRQRRAVVEPHVRKAAKIGLLWEENEQVLREFCEFNAIDRTGGRKENWIPRIEMFMKWKGWEYQTSKRCCFDAGTRHCKCGEKEIEADLAMRNRSVNMDWKPGYFRNI